MYILHDGEIMEQAECLVNVIVRIHMIVAFQVRLDHRYYIYFSLALSPLTIHPHTFRTYILETS